MMHFAGDRTGLFQGDGAAIIQAAITVTQQPEERDSDLIIITVNNYTV